MSALSPTAYAGRALASTSKVGQAQFDGNDFTVTQAGKVSLKAASIATGDIANDAVTSAKLSADTIQYATVTLTNANIKALAATQITLVAAPGAGFALEFVSAMLKLNAGSEALTEAGDNLGIKYTNAAGVQVCTTIECTGFIDQTVDTYTNAVPKADNIVAASACENKALVLDNLGSEFAGNASNDATMDIGIAYRVHAL